MPARLEVHQNCVPIRKSTLCSYDLGEKCWLTAGSLLALPPLQIWQFFGTFGSAANRHRAENSNFAPWELRPGQICPVGITELSLTNVKIFFTDFHCFFVWFLLFAQRHAQWWKPHSNPTKTHRVIHVLLFFSLFTADTCPSGSTPNTFGFRVFFHFLLHGSFPKHLESLQKRPFS